MQERTPNQIRDEAIKCFNQLAPAKYDAGQLEHGGLLDEREDIINDLRGEAIDFWFYVETAARQLEEKDEYIELLEAQIKLIGTAMESESPSHDGGLLWMDFTEKVKERIEFLEKQVKHYKEIASR